MKPLDMIKEWRHGCSCGGPVYDALFDKPKGTTHPYECRECTIALIDAIEKSLKSKKRKPRN